jgi:hypothetical protein
VDCQHNRFAANGTIKKKQFQQDHAMMLTKFSFRL